MRNIVLSFLGFIALLLTACSGSDAYRGNWKGMTPDGEKVQIAFEAKKFTITDSTQKVKTYNYTQNSVNIKNSIRTYGIKLDDGRGYRINFPLAGNSDIGLIYADNGSIIYSISRKEYVKSGEIYQLK